jgi:rhomboid-like protein
MTSFVFVVCLVCYGLGHYYIPPSPEYRLWPNLSPTNATILTIAAANILVTIAWRWAPFWPFLTRYFMHVPGYPLAIQSITNVFSHVQYEHLMGNLPFLLLAGCACHELVGRGVFVGSYVAAGAVGTLASLYWANLGRGCISSHSVGASAAIWGIAALYLLLTDRESIKLPFLKDQELPFWPKSLFAAFVAVEVYQATKRRTSMDHASHFGGMAVGISVASYLAVGGFHQRRAAAAAAGTGETTVQGKAGVDEKTLDVGAIVKEPAKEVKEAVQKAMK